MTAIYLFLLSDIKTMILPVSLLGTLSTLAGPELSTNPSPRPFETLSRFPLTFLWTYPNVLVFSIANQRLPPSMLEDQLNKPWRPIPSGRASPRMARRLLLVLIPAVYGICRTRLGAVHEHLLCTGGAWLYNDLGGADEHFILRNLLNAIAYFVYGSGAAWIAIGVHRWAPTAGLYHWLFVLAAVIFSTMQVQYLKDQDGDKARQRKTAPLQLGDWAARGSVAVGVLAWSMACPAYWRLGPIGYTIPLGLGAVVANQVLRKRGREDDRRTYVLWSLWLMSLFLLPLSKQSGALGVV